MNVDVARWTPRRSRACTTRGAHSQTRSTFLLNVIPNTVDRRVRQGRDPSGACSFALLFGFALSLRRRSRPAGGELHLTRSRTRYSSSSASSCASRPSARFGAMAFTIGKYGIGSLQQLAKLMGSFYLTCVLFIVVVLGLDRPLGGLSHLPLHRLHQGRAV